MATERSKSPDEIKEACTRLAEAARGNIHRLYMGDPMSRELDIVTVMTAARSHADMLDRLRREPCIMTTEPADSLIPPMTFMGIVVQINPALPPGCCQIIGPEGKLLATFQV